MKKRIIAAALAAASLVPFAAHAQDAAADAAAPAVTPTVGAKVFDQQGGEVGTIETVDAANAVVNTGAKKATLPLAAFGKNEKGLLLSMNKAQLEAAVTAAEAKTASATTGALVADAQVKSADGVVVGTIQKVEGDNVTLALTEGSPVTITKQYLTAQPDGSLALTMNADAFKAAVASATQSAATAQPGAEAQANSNAQNATTSQPGSDAAEGTADSAEPATN